MFSCAIASCPNSVLQSRSDSIKFHRFPLGDRNTLEKWITSMKLSELNPPLSNFVCDIHFESSCFEKGKLKSGSIPTVLDLENDNDFHNSKLKNVKGLLSIFEEKWGGFLCRVCGTILPENDMNLLFDDDVMEKLRCCLPFMMITINDDLPSHICGPCLNQIDALFKFRALTTVTDGIFSHINNVMKNMGTDEPTNHLFDGPKASWQKELLLRGPVSCNLCDIEFLKMEQFDSHMDQFHSLAHSQIQHKKYSSDKIQFICSTCGLIFRSQTDYSEHKQRIKYECKKCEQPLSSNCERKKHDCQRELLNFISDEMENMHDLSDDDTFRIYDDKYESKENNRNQFGFRIDLECEICGRQFLRRSNLVRHLARHEKEKEAGEFGCDKCEASFHKSRFLVQHRERAHKESSVWVCRFCGKHTTTKLSLTIHERIHTGVKPYICEWCGNTFRSKANLRQHQARHTGERRHGCPICGKMFSRRAFVKTHLRVHTGERPYCCDICQHRFTQVGDMRRHRRRHDVISQPPPPPPPASSPPTLDIITESQLYQLADFIPIIIQKYDST
ncbi:hypothetical protein LSTR_LSTR001677 [Laodelphax striatellus]|uniref:Protein krueppel n=1 Tax=Laodelphax striatellus TaxID=195883 RepID=A0A482XCD5_LAOST|nr:hypothetical protein LSTR_LSTR001677 [Laodelphax striatellus]